MERRLSRGQQKPPTRQIVLPTAWKGWDAGPLPVSATYPNSPHGTDHFLIFPPPSLFSKSQLLVFP